MFSNPRKGVVPSPTPRCGSYRKGILRVTLDYGHQQQYIYIYIYRAYCIFTEECHLQNLAKNYRQRACRSSSQFHPCMAFITQLTKSNFEEKSRHFLYTLHVCNSEITFPVRKQEIFKSLLFSDF